jgi:uncharacterized protein with von Willebrand factor type A (vWA) domain
VPDGPAFAGLLVRFARELRSAGVATGPGDALTYTAAAAALDPSDLADLYWAGRATLVRRRDDIAVYDRVFRQFFLAAPAPDAPGAVSPPAAPAIAELAAAIGVPPGDPAGEPRRERAELGLAASDIRLLRRKTFAACSEPELAALRKIMERMRIAPPLRRTRRLRSSRAGRALDPRATIRESLRYHGEPADLRWRRRRLRPRPLVLILDVSGSMASYSRALLQFAHCARRSARKVEVFCFGTTLTRITAALSQRRPDEALHRAADQVTDWDAGTRIGGSLDAFVRDWGRRGLSRGAIVVICSDGLDRGDPELLAGAMERLSRLCHRVIWLNPHKGDDPSFRPSTVGMMAAAPFVDELLSGHDLSSLEELARLLPALG